MRRLAALCLTTCLAGPAFAQHTYALVIGVDSYDAIPGLSGAVNDARDIADALTGIGAETVLLTDHDASRAAIIAEWTRLAEQAQPGDRLIVTYAGHGSNEAEATPGEEADGRDENWLLSGFSPYGEAAGERIRDNEIAALIGLNPAVQVILVSDSCHSGTVSREIAPVLGYRYYRTDGTLADDPLPPPPPPPAEGPEFGALAMYMGAVPDAEQVPEFLIDGAPRGALSWAFAAGVRGGADGDGDGAVSGAELESFVRAQVRDISRGLQRPQIEADDDTVLAFGAGGTPVLIAEAETQEGAPGTDPDAPVSGTAEEGAEVEATPGTGDEVAAGTMGEETAVAGSEGDATAPNTDDENGTGTIGEDTVEDTGTDDDATEPGSGTDDTGTIGDDDTVEVADTDDDATAPGNGTDDAGTLGEDTTAEVAGTDDDATALGNGTDNTGTTGDDDTVEVAGTDDDATPPDTGTDSTGTTGDDDTIEVVGTDDDATAPGNGTDDTGTTGEDVSVEGAGTDTAPLPDHDESDALPVDAVSPEETDPSPFLLAFADLPPVTLAAPAGVPGPEGAALLPAGTPADLVLDPATGDIRTMVGDLFATTGNDADALQRAIDNARIAAELMRPGRMQALAVSFAEGDGTYRDGDRLTVRVEGRRTPYLSLFSLSPDGSLVPIYPLHAPALGLDDPATLPPDATLDLTTQVGAPFGSDFLVAVETEAPSDALALLLSDPERLWDARSLWEALQMAEMEGAAPRVAVFPFHSRGE